MTDKSFIVVADKFEAFTEGKAAITLSHLKTMISLPKTVLPGPMRIIPGQGVSDEEVEEILSTIEAADPPEQQRWNISALRRLSVRAACALSHKHNPENTLIAKPVKVDDENFVVDLRIDQNCEFMNDHQSGQHVQGMVLVEAARQAFLAVTEEFFLKEADQKFFFVINSMQTTFQGFVFPIAASIQYRVITKDINDRRQRFVVEIDTVQSDEVKATTTFHFTVYPNQLIAEKEALMAETALKFALMRSKTLETSVAAN
ncbi:MAG: AfsA-related hotdog domain-containing protein [Pseudoruegeria sp.]